MTVLSLMRRTRRRPRLGGAVNSEFAQLTDDLAVEPLLVLTVPGCDQACRENRCRPQCLHVRHADPQTVTGHYETLAREWQGLGDQRRWQPQSETCAWTEQEPSVRTMGAAKEVQADLIRLMQPASTVREGVVRFQNASDCAIERIAVIYGYTATANSEEDIDEGVAQSSLRVSLEYGLA